MSRQLPDADALYAAVVITGVVLIVVFAAIVTYR